MNGLARLPWDVRLLIYRSLLDSNDPPLFYADRFFRRDYHRPEIWKLLWQRDVCKELPDSRDVEAEYKSVWRTLDSCPYLDDAFELARSRGWERAAELLLDEGPDNGVFTKPKWRETMRSWIWDALIGDLADLFRHIAVDRRPEWQLSHGRVGSLDAIWYGPRRVIAAAAIGRGNYMVHDGYFDGLGAFQSITWTIMKLDNELLTYVVHRLI